MVPTVKFCGMLVDREHELDVIEECLKRAGAGRGNALMIRGAAGIGKTALLRAAREQGELNGMRVLASSGGELEYDLPFAVVRQLLAPAVQQGELFTDAAALARPVFDAATDPASIAGVVHGLYWLCSNLADEAPLLLVVDDAHWTDEASLRFLSHLARRVDDLPILLALGSRPVPADHLLNRAFDGVALHTAQVGPLTPDGVGRLVRDALSAEADDPFCQACADASGGNPFLLTEALRTIQAERIRPVQAQADRVARLRPDGIATSVLTRLSRLGPEAVNCARAVAVLGPAAELRRVAHLAQLDTASASVHVDQLVAETILHPSRPLEFVHPLVRTAVYSDYSAFSRAQDHKRAARLLQADGVPIENHLLASEPDSDPWVVDTLRAGAASALAQGAPEVAAACLHRALAEPPPAAARGPILVELGRSLGMASQPAEAGEAFRSAYELATDPGNRADIALELGSLMIHTGHGAEAIAAYEMARQAIDPDDTELTDRMLVVFMMSMAAMQSPAEWIERLEGVLQRRQSNTPIDRMIIGNLAFVAAATGHRSAEETARLARLAAQGPIPEDFGWQLVNFSSAALAIADRYPEALDELDRGIDITRREGDAAKFGYLTSLRSHTALHGGRVLEAEADARAAYELSHDASAQDAPLAAAVLVDALVERGELAEAQRIMQRAGLDGELTMSMLIAHFVLVARGRLRLHQNRPQEALADLRLCGQALAGAGFVNSSFAPWRPDAVRALLLLGEVEQARELAAEDLELSRRFGAPRAIGAALHVSGLIEGGTEGLELLAEAVRSLESSTAESIRAEAMVDYGAALRRAGRKAQAGEALREGLDLATRCGAVPLAHKAHAELVASGARPRRARLTGPESLTASEMRVARLAADGATNRDIAQALFVSRRTVEIHLTNAYRKLGIESRQQLAEALRYNEMEKI